mmetsp:Transcript_28316/g.39988  ORF Transcript_28316/g.39988 Transcript_28316/m.39988 type:complete len:217 (-) Transcript_28316:93-743(-)
MESTFLGPRVPLEVKKLLPLLQKIKQEVIEQLYAKLVIPFVKGLNADTIEEEFESYVDESGLKSERENLAIVFTGLFYLLKAAVRSRPKPDVLQKDLQQELRLPPFLSNLILVTVKKYGKELENAQLDENSEHRIRYPATLEQLKWRVDVCISTHAQSRVLQPTILMEMWITSSNGLPKRKQFELSVEKFHELRFNTAKLLKDMNDVQNHPILKIE